MASMSRTYAVVFMNILTRPKYRKLSPAGRGALLHLWALAGTQDPEATWDSRDEILDAFELDGFDASHVDELIALRWLDIEPDGTLTVHDWDQWEMAASADIRRKYEASRKRVWRRTQNPLLSALSTQESREDKRRLDKRSPGHVRDVSGTYDGNHEESHVITGKPTAQPVTYDRDGNEVSLREEGGTQSIDLPALSGLVKSIDPPPKRPEPTPWGEWPEVWHPFLKAWERCGFKEPPTPFQRKILSPVVTAIPTVVARWVDESGSGKPSDVVTEVLRRWKARESAVLPGSRSRLGPPL